MRGIGIGLVVMPFLWEFRFSFSKRMGSLVIGLGPVRLMFYW